MKKVSKSKMTGEIAYSYHKDPGNIIIGKTKAEFEKERNCKCAGSHLWIWLITERK